jgi:hypothetical protein
MAERKTDASDANKKLPFAEISRAAATIDAKYKYIKTLFLIPPVKYIINVSINISNVIWIRASLSSRTNLKRIEIRYRMLIKQAKTKAIYAVISLGGKKFSVFWYARIDTKAKMAIINLMNKDHFNLD